MMPGFKYCLTILLSIICIPCAQNCNENEVELWGNCYSIEYTDSLDLSGLYLSGEIPLEIGDLTNLNFLNLAANNLSGVIPDEIGYLSNLNYLFLQNNEFTGAIPSSIGNLFNLISLKLYGNSLSGEIPVELGNITSLEYISISSNHLSGPIPEEFENLVNLEKLYLFDNNLSGSLPSGIGQLTKLSHLYLNGNSFVGHMPGIGNLNNLTRIYLYDNQLTGELPCDMCELETEWDNPSLVKISGNQFCPPYPECIIGNVGIQDTSNCESIPEMQFTIWGQCYMVETTDSINLGGTGLSGPIPPEIGSLINLKYLLLHDNSLNGEIPSSIGNLENLTHLYLYENDLNGPLPSEIGDLENITQLLLYSNAITGEIPDAISNLITLEQLFLYDNQLTGGLPFGLENLTNLQYLYLNDNQLSGNLDDEICFLDFEWSNAIHFNIFNNLLCPPYPICIENYIGYQDTTTCDGALLIQKENHEKFIIYNGFPNPFNSSIKIQFNLPKSETIKIYIYDISGKVVWSIYSGEKKSGYNSINWNGKNNRGYSVATGVYFFTVEAENFRETKKIVMVQ